MVTGAGGNPVSVHPSNLGFVERNLIASARRRVIGWEGDNLAVGKEFRKQSRRRLENYDVVKWVRGA
jgi:hypothetical protein